MDLKEAFKCVDWKLWEVIMRDRFCVCTGQL